MPHIQIRNVPPELHRKLKARAAAQGLTLSDYLLKEAEIIASIPTPEELAARIQELAEVDPREDSGSAIRAERDRR
jgi:plasmid stability protein